MKKIIIMLVMAAALASSAVAAVTAKESAAAVAKTIQVEVFSAKEFQFESAYTVRTEDFDKWKESVTIGGNYYVTKGAGLHAGVALNDLEGPGVDLVEFGFIGRVPIDKIRTALLFGVGSEFRTGRSCPNDSGENSKEKKSDSRSSCEEDDWAVYAEAGILFRLNRHLDVFAKVRGVRPINDADKEHIGVFAGITIPFSLK